MVFILSNLLNISLRHAVTGLLKIYVKLKSETEFGNVFAGVHDEEFKNNNMSTENLYNQEAVEKLKEMTEQIKVGMLCTRVPGTGQIHAVPMHIQETDDQGNIWFLFSSESESFRHLEAYPQVSLLFSDPGSYSFLSIHADTEISHNREKIDIYWSAMAAAWFDGKEDPRIQVLRIKPLEAHYWDNQSNKLVTFLKIAISGITGSQTDAGREGDLNL